MHFLEGMIDGRTDDVRLVNLETGQTIAERLLPAFDSKSRRTGLLGHHTLPSGHAMVIAPCSSVHTFFMKFPIDVVYVKKDGQVIKVRERMPAWRLSGAIGAFAVIELNGGEVSKRGGCRPGARLSVVLHQDSRSSA